tara:strand:- start:1636 stop:2460 length:825 start_codon:yes stop_codon:yes gene_type:complete
VPNHDLTIKKTLQEDKKLAYSSNEERELRLKYPFANMFIQFPTTGDSVTFPAYLKNLQDSFTPNFTAVSVFGRMDDIPIYQSTKRSLSFSLTMPAYNEPHARQILKDINTIIKNLYPSYVNTNAKDTRILNAPPLIRIKFANLICDYTNPSRGLLGYVNGQIGITHGLDTSGMFLIEDEGDGVIYAKTYEIQFNMNVLHEETPGFAEDDHFMGNENFPYAVDSSSTNFFNEQVDGDANTAATGTDASRLAGSTGGSGGKELIKNSKAILTKQGN